MRRLKVSFDKNSKMHYLISLFYVMFILYTPISQAAPVKWKINKYKIVQQSVSETRNSVKKETELQEKRDSDLSGLVFGLKTAQVKELEEYLVKVGEEYQRLGFKEPRITSKTKNNDTYEVFYFNYDDGLPTAYYEMKYSTSDGEKLLGIDPTFIGNFISIDSSRALTSKNNYKLGEKVFEDLGHELFHAIQASYPTFKNNNDLGDWIVEGTATAIGEDVALKLGKLKKIKNWGQRTYSNTLWVPDLEGDVVDAYPGQEGHRTSGFWRYIGEYISSGRKARTKQVKPPSYKYLAKLFEKRIYGKTNDRKELDWVDTFLKSTESMVGRGIGDIYPLFINTITHYVPDRSSSKRADAVQIWHKCLFVSGLDCRKTSDFNAKDIGCERVDLSKDSTEHVTSATSFRKVSARCFEVFYTGPADKLDVQIYIESDDKEIINSIRTIGFQTNPLNGSKKIIKVLESTKGDFDNYPSIGLWDFQGVGFRRPKKMQKSVVFVVSNVARISSQTYEGSEKVKFNFSYSSSTGNVQLSN